MAKTVLITGCSRGIGLALVKECVNLGHKVIATCRNPSAAKELNDLLAKNSQPEAVQLDVADHGSIKAAYEKVKGITPALDILINNAGTVGSYPGRVLNTTADEMLSAYRVNVVGPLLVNQTFLPTLNRGAAPPGPVVVNMSPAVASLYDKVARGVTPYRCSKVALNMMNVNFAREVPDVIWLALHPGWVDTEMGRNFGPKPSMKPEQSAAAILKTVSKVTKEDSGFFVDYSGKKLPF